LFTTAAGYTSLEKAHDSGSFRLDSNRQTSNVMKTTAADLLLITVVAVVQSV
jgi:hypothetical protein